MALLNRERWKTGILTLLIALSLFLSSQIWLSPEAASLPRGYRATYVVPGQRGDLTSRDVIQPLGITLYFEGRYAMLGPEDQELARFLWQGLTELAARVDPAGLKPLSVDAVNRFFESRDGVIGFEAALPGRMNLSVWQQLWGKQPVAAGGWDSPVEQAALFVHGDEISILFRTPTGVWGQVLDIHRLEPARARDVAASIQRILPTAIASDLPTAVAVDATPGLRVAAPVVAAAPVPEPPLVQLAVPDLNWELIASSFFPKLAVARQLLTEELRIYTDGETSLSIRPQAGLVEYQVPAAVPAGGAEGSEGPLLLPWALESAIAFGNEHGGWPEGTFLQNVSIIRARGSWEQLDEAPPPIGYRFEFAIKMHGVPVDGLTIAEMEVGPDGVTFWRRRFRVNRLNDHIALVLQPPMLAVERVAGLPAEELPPESRLLRHLQLAYSTFGDEFYKPVWLLHMHDGTRVRVDAWNGWTFMVVRPN